MFINTKKVQMENTGLIQQSNNTNKKYKHGNREKEKESNVDR